MSSAGELYQRRLPETVSRRQADQTTQAGLHDTNFTLDLCTILQSKWTSNLFISSNWFNSKLIAGSALRLSSHSDVVFHLRDHRYAGTYVPVGEIPSTFVTRSSEQFPNSVFNITDTTVESYREFPMRDDSKSRHRRRLGREQGESCYLQEQNVKRYSVVSGTISDHEIPLSGLWKYIERSRNSDRWSQQLSVLLRWSYVAFSVSRAAKRSKLQVGLKWTFVHEKATDQSRVYLVCLVKESRVSAKEQRAKRIEPAKQTKTAKKHERSVATDHYGRVLGCWHEV